MRTQYLMSLALASAVAVTSLVPVAAFGESTPEPAPAINFSGFIDTYYSFNSNDPANHENFFPGAGTTAKRANEFAINLVQVQWTRAVSEEQPVGFTLGLVAGEGTDVVHGGEPGGPDKFRNVYQASIAYRMKSGLVLEGGVYPSHIGMEGFYSKDNWNYTRSIIGEASPYYQTGVKASYAFDDHWSVRADLLNGWQNINDNNDGKSIGTQIAYTSDALTASLNTFYGPELAGDDDSMRKFVDLVVLYRVSPTLQLGGTADFGAQEYPDSDDANWNGVGLYARYTPNERHAFAIRAEQFDDSDNGITGAAQELSEVTLTWEVRPRKNLILKLEARKDDSDASVFAEEEGTTDGQFIATLGVVVTF